MFNSFALIANALGMEQQEVVMLFPFLAVFVIFGMVG
tara:strand:+ start:1633 stop:1743 length:111 start_codon:yes stop_codon:yes gene_type:complete